GEARAPPARPQEPPADRLGRVGVAGTGDTGAAAELREDLVVRARLAGRTDGGPRLLQHEDAVATGDLRPLEERRRRKDDVRVARGVGQDRIEDDREEVLALE